MYADEIDRANEIAQAITDENIRVASTYKKRHPLVPGQCDICENPTPTEEHLFCCLDCSKTDEREQRMLAMRGSHVARRT